MKGKPEEAEKKADVDVLFPEQRVCGYTVRPWTWGQITELGQDLAAVIDEMRKEGVKADRLDMGILAALLRATGATTRIVAVSIGQTEDHIMSLMPDVVGRLLVTIVSANWEYLKNSFGLDRAFSVTQSQSQTEA
ncbi:MAG: hypothetical protein ABIN58_11125 [candidate division WOR-3 bacterium]